MRYRAQRIVQHPERYPKERSKRISVIGEKTLMKILHNISIEDNLLTVRIYLGSFFNDLIWDDPIVFENLYETVIQSVDRNVHSTTTTTMFAFNRIHFIDNNTWNLIIQTLELSLQSSYVEEPLYSIMK